MSLLPVREELRAGLDRAEKLGVGRGYAEVSAGLRGLGLDVAAFVRGELGYRPSPGVSLFAFGEAAFAPRLPPSYMAGVGARFNW